MTTQQQTRSVTVTTPSEREIHFERVFDAPRDVVWRTFTDPTLISQWWGGGTKVEHMDVRTGGSWKFVADNGPEARYVFQGEYLEIDPPRRIMQTFENGWMPGPPYTETMEFEDLGSQTRLNMTTTFDTVEQRDMVLESAEVGANYTYARLDQLLAKLSNQTSEGGNL